MNKNKAKQMNRERRRLCGMKWPEKSSPGKHIMNRDRVDISKEGVSNL